MSSTPKFDPYYRWLGISPKDQPPHHYRLLAVDLFESDVDVIALAADQRMAHLKTFQSGATSALSQRLLNEVATARVCLLNAQKKAAYDAQLRAKLGKRTQTKPARADMTATPLATALPQAEPAPPDVISSFVVSEAASGESRNDRGNASRKRAIRGKSSGMKGPGTYSTVILVVGVVGLAAILWVRANKWQIQLVEADPSKPIPTESARKADKAAENDKRVQPSKQSTKAARATDENTDPLGETVVTKATAKTSPAPKSPVPETPAATIVHSNSAPEQPDVSTNALVPAQPVPVNSNQPRAQSATQATGLESPIISDSRLPIPDADSQDKASQLVKEVFKDDFVHAKTPSQKAALAEKLLKQADATVDDPVARYVMLQAAQKLATDAAELSILDHAITGLSNIYAIDADEVRAESFEKVGEKSLSSKLSKTLAEAASATLDELESNEHYELAERYQTVALAAARKAQAPALLKQVADRSKSLATATQQWEAAKKATTVLVDSPEDAEANLALGKYLCFARGEWEEGFPHLAKGSDAKLAELAKQSIEKPNDGAAQADLRDAWWNAAEKSSASSKAGFQKGSRYWYSKAVDKLNGLARARVEQRLETLTSGEGTSRDRATSKLAYVQSMNHPAKYLTPQSDRFGLVEKAQNSLLKIHLAFHGKGTVAFEATDRPGWFLVQSNINGSRGEVHLREFSNTKDFKRTATFLVAKPVGTNDAQYVSFQSILDPSLYLSHRSWTFHLRDMRGDEDRQNSTFRFVEKAGKWASVMQVSAMRSPPKLATARVAGPHGAGMIRLLLPARHRVAIALMVKGKKS